MTYFRLIYLYLVLLIVAGCSSGGDDPIAGDPDDSEPSAGVTISALGGAATAIEKSGQMARFQIARSSGTGPVSIGFTLSGNPDPIRGSATADDFELRYGDGRAVQGNTLTLPANQSSRVIEVRPVADSLNEAPEMASFSLAPGSDYTLGASTTVAVSIIDAAPTEENRKVFLGTFVPQDGVATGASGTASFILQGDNVAGMMNYTFSNLTSPQVDQHIHLINGPILKDIDAFGPVLDFPWELSLGNGAPFTSEQELLDALYEGRVFVNIHTADNLAGEILAVFSYDASVEAPSITSATPGEVDLDIIRFLNQATFGARPEDYTALRQRIEPDGQNRLDVYSDWIDEQLELPLTELLPFVDAQTSLFPDAEGQDEPGHLIRKDAFWTVAVFAKDQLRQRVAYALSQILVISEENTDVRNAYRGTADYYDTLARHATLTYRDLLEEVSRHSVMGAYLSHLRNEKEDPEAGYFPDENYAREIMQLFTFGLVARDRDGSIKLGPNNLPIQTYDNDVIREMAQVFTGLSFGSRAGNGQIIRNSNFGLANNFGNEFQFRWTEPMRFFNNRHDMTEKLLFTDNGVQVVIPAGMQPGQELDLVIDALVAHSGTAPYVSERLIQRFVTSNPSPGYIARVAEAFGPTGDMRAVIRAIFLDEEARNTTVMADPQFGKFKEPVLQLAATMRLHDASSAVVLDSEAASRPGIYALNYPNANQFEDGATLLRIGTMNIGQAALNSPSVFNFYSPDFSPTGALSNNALVAPELELVTETQIYSAYNVYNNFIRNGVRRNNRYARQGTFISQEQLRVRLSNAHVQAIWNSTTGDATAKATAVAEFLDLYINAGRLSYIDDSVTLEEYIIAMANANVGTGELFELAVYGAALLPEFMVQK
ncbi:MAG: DUF1800 family protein [Candidatus Rariloculaceae bacterium]